MFKAEVKIELKPGILDAEGRTTKNALNLLGFKEISDVKSIKLFEIQLSATSKSEAKEKVENACRKLLANPVINNYSISVKEV